MKNAAPVPAPAAFTTPASKSPRPLVSTIRRERSVMRHEFSPVTHRAPGTLATMGLLWLAAAGSSARS